MTALHRIAAVHLVCIASTFAAATLAVAAGSSKTAADVEQQYQKERAACISGNTNQDRTVCLREAGAARQEALKNNLDKDGANYQQNQLERCKSLPADEQATCRDRMRDGATSGSAQRGGIYRELTTVETPSPAKPATQPRGN